MKQQDKEKQMNRRQTLDRLCSGSGLLLSVVCCIALIHVELRIQEHHRLISHSVTFRDKMEREILQKVQENYGRWQAMARGRHWQTNKGRFRYVTDVFNRGILRLFVSYCGAPAFRAEIGEILRKVHESLRKMASYNYRYKLPLASG